jgi:urease accessory protein
MTQNSAAVAKNITSQTSINSTINSRQWLASLALDFSHNALGTKLSRTKRNGPLSVQKAFYPEGADCAHIYLLHPPAGIVSGDELQVDITLAEQAHTLVTTPGANRFYRAREDVNIGVSKQVQVTTLSLANKAICENFPLETIVYNGADAFNTVDIHLTGDSVYLGWDITCLGLPSSEQSFTQGQYTQLNRVYCDNELIYHDRIAISAKNKLLEHPAGLAKNNVFATLLIYAPTQLHADKYKDVINTLRAAIDNEQAEKHISVTNIDGLIVIRYIGKHAEQCKKLFVLLWQILRPLTVKKPAMLPRIWYT